MLANILTRTGTDLYFYISWSIQNGCLVDSTS